MLVVRTIPVLQPLLKLAQTTDAKGRQLIQRRLQLVAQVRVRVGDPRRVDRIAEHFANHGEICSCLDTPQIMAPRRPLPIGRASVHVVAGWSYHSTCGSAPFPASIEPSSNRAAATTIPNRAGNRSKNIPIIESILLKQSRLGSTSPAGAGRVHSGSRLRRHCERECLSWQPAQRPSRRHVRAPSWCGSDGSLKQRSG